MVNKYKVRNLADNIPDFMRLEARLPEAAQDAPLESFDRVVGYSTSVAQEPEKDGFLLIDDAVLLRKASVWTRIRFRDISDEEGVCKLPIPTIAICTKSGDRFTFEGPSAYGLLSFIIAVRHDTETNVNFHLPPDKAELLSRLSTEQGKAKKDLVREWVLERDARPG